MFSRNWDHNWNGTEAILTTDIHFLVGGELRPLCRPILNPSPIQLHFSQATCIVSGNSSSRSGERGELLFEDRQLNSRNFLGRDACYGTRSIQCDLTHNETLDNTCGPPFWDIVGFLPLSGIPEWKNQAGKLAIALRSNLHYLEARASD